MFGLKRKVATAARQAGFFSAGLLFLMAGLGFLTLAAWIYLQHELGAQYAALTLAGVYLGVAFIFFAVGSVQSSDPHPQPASLASSAASDPPGPPVMQAFLHGLQAGMSAGQNRSDPKYRKSSLN